MAPAPSACGRGAQGMWRVRPAQRGDQQKILDLAVGQGPRLSSTLPKTEGGLGERIARAAASLAGPAPEMPRRILLVLENIETGEIAGTAGIDARAGNGEPFYNYRRDHLIHASHELGIARRVEMLYPSHALTDCSLLCALDRKSTRLNSSHVRISYAVFCLKKKK